MKQEPLYLRHKLICCCFYSCIYHYIGFLFCVALTVWNWVMLSWCKWFSTTKTRADNNKWYQNTLYLAKSSPSVLTGATTAEAWTTTPKSASCHLSPKSAISARASTTWLPTAQSKHNSPRRALRENRLPRKEMRRSTATRCRRPRPQSKPDKVWRTPMPGKQRSQSNCFDGEMGLVIPFYLSKLLLELPQVKKEKKHSLWRMLLIFFCLFFPFGVTLRNTAVLLHSGRFLNIWITAVIWVLRS